MPLGAPEGKYEITGDIYWRPFENALIIVSPDDGKGGRFELDQAMYTPEGARLRGELELEPGTGLTVLKSEPKLFSSRRRLDLESLSDWSAASWVKGSGDMPGFLSWGGLGDSELGEHDLLVTNKRFMNPESLLRLKLRPGGESTRILVVADIDDPQRKADTAVIVIATDGEPSIDEKGPTPRFRAGVHRRGKVPFISGAELEAGQWQSLELNGEDLDMRPCDFQGWRYIRFMGPGDVAQNILERRVGNE